MSDDTINSVGQVTQGRMTVAKIAEVAGVSVATVSRVINNSAGVSETAAAAVQSAMEQLNYTPRARSRRPSSLRHGRIGFVTIGYNGEYWREMPVLLETMAGASHEANEQGISFQVEALRDRQYESNVLQGGAVDGAILLISLTTTDEDMRRLAPTVPLVQVMGWPNRLLPIDMVAFSNTEVGALAFRYLNEKRCGSYAFLTWHPDRSFTRSRAYAYSDSAGTAGYKIHHFAEGANETYSRIFGDRVAWSDDREKLVARLLETMTPPIGVFLPTDWEAVVFCTILARRGVQVGRDIMVCSCDNERVRLSALEYPPATIDVHAFDVGRMAAKRLIARIQNLDDPPLLIELQPTLVVPGSPHSLDKPQS
jgi:DNA-binding LacI/PurR family transcriptional regulator